MDYARKIIKYIEESPSCFHAVAAMKKELEGQGFSQLGEQEIWNIKKGGKYYVTRNNSALIAFVVPHKAFGGFQIMASHSDSPTFKLKENAEIEVDKKYVKLNVEKYGGMLYAPWYDRPLSVAGRVLVRDGQRVYTRLVNVDRDLVLIPNLAIHFNREANEGYKYNAQVDMLPLFGGKESKGQLDNLIAEAAGVEKENIVGSDLFLYNRQPGTIWGAAGEFLSAPRLDDLQCAFSSLMAFLEAENEKNVMVHCVLDNEEVGSGTKQGAASTFLKDVLHRICYSLGCSEEEYLTALSGSFMVSADNGHSVHPNKSEKSDPVNRPYMNEGVIIKYNGNQQYTTDGVSAGIFKTICERAQVPFQYFNNRSDVAGGSTLGNISSTQVALNTVDIGLAQLAMHSPYETGGVMDTEYLVGAAREFYSSYVMMEGDGAYLIKK